MGSKQSLLPFLFRHLDPLKYETVLDAFAGSCCVSYEFKKKGKSIVANDFLHWSYVIAKALIENNSVRMDDQTLSKLMTPRSDSPRKVTDTFSNLFFTEAECLFLDSLWANIKDLEDKSQQYLAIAAACRAIQKKRPRGIFTFTGKKSWDNRRDLKISFQEQFANAVRLLNDAIFDNGRKHKASCSDIMELRDTNFDLVYLDPPYWSPLSDNDYVRRYHFVEGYSRYWDGLEIDLRTRSRKFRSYESVFSKRASATKALQTLFERYSNSIIAVSYSSNGYPTKSEISSMLSSVKTRVEVFEVQHRYSFGNQRGKKVKNRVREYLFIGK